MLRAAVKSVLELERPPMASSPKKYLSLPKSFFVLGSPPTLKSPLILGSFPALESLPEFGNLSAFDPLLAFESLPRYESLVMLESLPTLEYLLTSGREEMEEGMRVGCGPGEVAVLYSNKC